jgi:hypothetical protein
VFFLLFLRLAGVRGHLAYGVSHAIIKGRCIIKSIPRSGVGVDETDMNSKVLNDIERQL